MSYTDEERAADEQYDRDATQERIALALEQLVELLRDQQRVRDGMRFSGVDAQAPMMLDARPQPPISDLLKTINERKVDQ